MSDEDKRVIPGEPEDFDDFANAWYDDDDKSVGVCENPGKICPLPEMKLFAREIAHAPSLNVARNIVEKWGKLFKQRGSGDKKQHTYGGALAMLDAIDAMKHGGIEPRYQKGSGKTPSVVRYMFPIFTCGNIKLPFWTWSKLPVYTCPGAGACSQICYSLKHLSQPAPFYTWAQNTLLAHFVPEVIAEAFAMLPDASVLRLHVDGDFETVEEIAGWMEILSTRPPVFDGHKLVGGISAYSYTKSWDQVLEYDANGTWAKGLFLNISSGSRYENHAEKKARVLAVPCVRGEFVVIDDERLPHRLPGRKLTEEQKDAMSEERIAIVSEDMKEIYKGRKWFVCRGKCAVCVDHRNGVYGHACGDKGFGGMVIGIGRH